MSNNNDWAQQPNNEPGPPADNGSAGRPSGGQQSGQPPGADPPGSTYPHPPPVGNGPPADLLTENWGGSPEVGFDEVVERLKLVFKRAFGSPVFKAFMLVGASLLLIELIGSVMYILNYYIDSSVASGVLSMIHGGISSVETPLSFLVSAAQLALFKPLHRELFDGPGSVGGLGDALRSAGGIFWMVLVAYLVLVLFSGLGLGCCILPGLLLAFVFIQAPYLAATQDIGLVDAFKSSFFLNKTYWSLLLGVILAVSVVVGVAGVVYVVGTLIVGTIAIFLEPFGLTLAALVFWVSNQLGTFGLFIVQAAVFSLIETKETGRAPEFLNGKRFK